MMDETQRRSCAPHPKHFIHGRVFKAAPACDVVAFLLQSEKCRVLHHVVSQHVTTKANHDAGKTIAYPSRTKDANCFPGKREAGRHPLQAKISVPHAVVHLHVH